MSNELGQIVIVDLAPPAAEPGSEPGATRQAPAIVTAVNEDGSVNLRVFSDGLGTGDLYRQNVDLGGVEHQADDEDASAPDPGDASTSAAGDAPAGEQAPDVDVEGSSHADQRSGAPGPNVG